jgi:hypothetical protein
VGLAQLIRFLVVKLTYHQFQIIYLTWVLHLRLITLSVGDDVPVDNEVLLVTDFMNLKIKPTQSFRCAHRNRVCVHIFI